jgi:hypothetical protein
MRYIGHGETREVFLIGKYAIKIPKLRYGWENLRLGLRANRREATLGASGRPELCPVLWSTRGGWLVVMPLCAPLTEADFNSWLADGAFGEAGRDIPCEWKQDCFGYLEGRIVCVDYGL